MINGKSFFDLMESEGKGDFSWKELADEYGFTSGDSIRKVWKRYENAKGIKNYIPVTTAAKANLADKLENREACKEAIVSEYITQLEDTVTNFMEDVKKGEAELSMKMSSEIRNLEELIERTKIDTKVWEITKYVQNYWGNSTTPHWQVKAWLSRKAIDPADKIINFFANYTSPYVPITSEQIIINNKQSNPTCCFIALTDVHLDKQTVDGQSLVFKVKQYQTTLETLLSKAYHTHNIDEIVFTVGHDLFNTDTFFNTTTNGTQQYNNVEWDESYEAVYKSQIEAIKKLKQFCNKLYVKYIPSNHARQKEYYLVHALSVYFQHDKNIVFDRTSENTKVHVYGQNFIGMHHGDTKIEKLPLYFAQKYYKEWGSAKYKEIAVGDKHTKSTWNAGSTELEGVRVFMNPHMGGYGQWDKQKLFDNGIQAGICVIYDKDKGKCAEFEERI